MVSARSLLRNHVDPVRAWQKEDTNHDNDAFLYIVYNAYIIDFLFFFIVNVSISSIIDSTY